MSRYVEGSENLRAVVTEVLNTRFQMFSSLNIKLVFDTKKRLSKGNVVLSSVELANEKVRFLTADNDNPEGFDYIMVVDSVAWEYASDEDKRRLVSHELNHIFIDEKGKLKIVGHDVEDFALEIQRNVDKPNWSFDLATLTTSIYEQSEDQ